MGIHPDWVHNLKENVPDAFTPKPAFDPKLAVIDGMPLLMAGGHIEEWEHLVIRNFFYPIIKYYKMGCRVVTLSFDDYQYVSRAKSITQANRDKQKTNTNCDERQHLECKVPHDFNEKLRNRTYKRMVIDCIVASLPAMIESSLPGGKSFIIDYLDCPIRYFINTTTKKLEKEFMQMPPVRSEHHFFDNRPIMMSFFMIV
jgi:hypothetical protein